MRFEFLVFNHPTTILSSNSFIKAYVHVKHMVDYYFSSLDNEINQLNAYKKILLKIDFLIEALGKPYWLEAPNVPESKQTQNVSHTV